MVQHPARTRLRAGVPQPTADAAGDRGPARVDHAGGTQAGAAVAAGVGHDQNLQATDQDAHRKANGPEADVRPPSTRGLPPASRRDVRYQPAQPAPTWPAGYDKPAVRYEDTLTIANINQRLRAGQPCEVTDG